MTVLNLTTALPGLAAWEATLAGIGQVWDQQGGPVTPDAVTQSTNGKPQIIHIAPWKGVFETDGRGTGSKRIGGASEEVMDEDTILSLLLVGPLATKKTGTLQALTRPWIWAYRNLIRQHSRLYVGPAISVWKARVESYKAGPIIWGSQDGSPNWYGVEFTLTFIYTNDIASGGG